MRVVGAIAIFTCAWMAMWSMVSWSVQDKLTALEKRIEELEER